MGADRFHPPEDGAAAVVSGQQLLQPAVRARVRWVRRCAQAGAAGARVVLLIPAHTDTRIWHEAMATTSSLLFIKDRVKFGIPRSNGRHVAASHPSALVGWNVDLRLAGELGTAVPLRNPEPG